MRYYLHERIRSVEAKRFQPYWWSPVTALADMDDLPVAWIDGEFVNTKPFSLPIERTYDYVGYPVRLVEHAHDEPFYVGMRSKDLFKGCKNAYFKYGGVGIEFAEPLARAGLLKRDPVEVDGQMVNTHHAILNALPQPPRFAREIEEIIEEGLVSDTGAFVVEALGKKDGKEVRVESHPVRTWIRRIIRKIRNHWRTVSDRTGRIHGSQSCL